MKDGAVRTVRDVIPATEVALATFASDEAIGHSSTLASYLLIDSAAVDAVLAVRSELAGRLSGRVGIEWVDTRLVGKSLVSLYLPRKVQARVSDLAVRLVLERRELGGDSHRG